jgi:hypothetical protein
LLPRWGKNRKKLWENAVWATSVIVAFLNFPNALIILRFAHKLNLRVSHITTLCVYNKISAVELRGDGQELHESIR